VFFRFSGLAEPMNPDTALDVLVRPSPNHGARDPRLDIDILLLHYTGMPEADGALDWLCREESQVSAHYFVYEDGRIVQMVPEARRAWHAGAAYWAGERDINGCSIGIEIANGGPDSASPGFPPEQMDAVIALCRDILKRHEILPQRVLGHSDVAPGRKSDPGAFFDWRMLSAAGIGLMVKPEPVVEGPVLGLGDSGRDVRHLQKALRFYGYGVEVSGVYDEASACIVEAFQRHFRPARIDGVADISTRKTLDRLLQGLDAAGA
jgi:N-acetylmuramoyl-L-alanine amidase